MRLIDTVTVKTTDNTLTIRSIQPDTRKQVDHSVVNFRIIEDTQASKGQNICKNTA